MSEKARSSHRIPSRTWVEIDKDALKHNVRVFRSAIRPGVQLMAVVKSNAYGHGLSLFSLLADKYGVDGFCVDSLVEGVKLREAGITKPIWVLGYVFPEVFSIAAEHDVTITLSSPASVEKYCASRKARPSFHVKVDTGMHRQGFSADDAIALFDAYAKNAAFKKGCTGIYTHFASAKDITYPTYTERQFSAFERVTTYARSLGFTNLTCHCAATGGTLLDAKYHCDAVRVGIGLYGLWPSKELELQRGVDAKITLRQVMRWMAVVGEVKTFEKGEYVGYDLTERVPRRTRAAIIPIGYWHGYPRSLSSVGEVLIRGKKCRVIGRVAMDMIVVETPSSVREGDVVSLMPDAAEVARRAGTVHYEFITRVNPRIERRAV